VYDVHLKDEVVSFLMELNWNSIEDKVVLNKKRQDKKDGIGL